MAIFCNILVHGSGAFVSCVCLWRMLFLLSRSIECIVDDDDYDDKDDSKLSLNSIN